MVKRNQINKILFLFITIVTLAVFIESKNKIPRLANRKLVDTKLSESLQGTDQLTSIDYNHDTDSAKKTVTNSYKRQNFRLDFSKKMPKFIKLEVKNTKSGSLNPLVYFSSTDENCNEGREQMVKSVYGDTVTLWLKQDEFSGGDLYILVECVEDSCNYDLSFTHYTI